MMHGQAIIKIYILFWLGGKCYLVIHQIHVGLIQLRVLGYKVVIIKLKLLLRNRRSSWIASITCFLTAVSVQKHFHM